MAEETTNMSKRSEFIGLLQKTNDMSALEKFYWLKEVGTLMGGPEGLAMAQSALPTGIGILMTCKLNGLPLYGNDYSENYKGQPKCNIDFKGKKITVIENTNNKID